MRAVGIIAEYNPFHCGHAWHIAETRRRAGDAAVVCVMSGNWVQRGECALLDKHLRAAAALRHGADLVLELPTPWAAAPAETFARGAVGLLAATGVVQTVSFGSEAGELAPLHAAARCLNSRDYERAVARALGTGRPFAALRQAAVTELAGAAAGAALASANNNLGVEYLRAIEGTGLEAMTVPRRGAGHDAARESGGFASASLLREWIWAGEGEKAAPYLPEWDGAWEIARFDRCERAVLARLRLMSVEDFAALPDSGAGEGLPQRLYACARRAASPEAFLQAVKTKRYSYARLRRLVLWAFLGLREADRPARTPYLRVLGFNARGRAVLREIEGRAEIPILTKPAHAARLGGEALRLFELEARCTDLYGLCLERVPPGGAEWARGPVVLA